MKNAEKDLDKMKKALEWCEKNEVKEEYAADMANAYIAGMNME